MLETNITRIFSDYQLSVKWYSHVDTKFKCSVVLSLNTHRCNLLSIWFSKIAVVISELGYSCLTQIQIRMSVYLLVKRNTVRSLE